MASIKRFEDIECWQLSRLLEPQLYRTLDREYITTEKFNELYNQTDLICKKISSLMNYLSGSDLKGSKYK